MLDPAGHYAALGLAPAASADAVAAAFRAAARRLHPDVPVTGDTDAFIRVRQAYEVLSDPMRRAAYDRAARRIVAAGPAVAEPAPVDTRIPREAWRRPAGVALGLTVGAALVAAAALVFGLNGLTDRPRNPASMPAYAPPQPQPQPQPRPRPPPAAAAPAAPPPAIEGMQGYILPEGEDARLWHPGSDGHYLPAGAVAPFTPVTVGRLDTSHGMAEVRAADGRAGFVAAGRIAPGDATEAERARCIYGAGPPPRNAEVLARKAEGHARMQIENRRNQPAVVKLRDPSGAAVAAAFVAPGATAELDRLPIGTYRPDVAFGELWSQACGRFVAGMQARRFVGYQRLDETAGPEVRYVIPPADGVELSDEEFRRD